MSNITRAERLAAELRPTMPCAGLALWADEAAAELRRLAESEAKLLEALQDLVDALTGRIGGEVVALHNALVVIGKTKEARNG